MILVAKIKSMVGKEEHVTPTIESTILPLKAMTQNSPEEVSVDEAPTETASKMGTVGCSEKDPTKVVRMEKVVDNSKKDLTMMMETERSLEMETPAGHFLASIAHAGPSDPMPCAPSTEEILRSTMEYLRNLLSPIERLFLNEQRERSDLPTL